MILKIQTVLPQAVSKSGRGSCKASICLFLVRPRMFYIWGSIESSQYRFNLFIFCYYPLVIKMASLPLEGQNCFLVLNYIDGISRQSHFWTRTPVVVWLWKHQRLGSPITPAFEAFPLPAPCVCHSVVTYSCGPLDCSPPGSCPWDSPGKNTGSGQPFPSPGDLPDPGIKPGSPALQADSLPSESPGKPLQCPGCLQRAHRSHSFLPCPFCPHRGHWFCLGTHGPCGPPWPDWHRKPGLPFGCPEWTKPLSPFGPFFLSLGAFHLFGHISVTKKPNKPVGPNCS